MMIETMNRDQILKQNQSERSKCLVYTRVMGYHRPVESFNIGKKGEHRQRTHFAEPATRRSTY